MPALKYLSRYLYRGVMPEKDILSARDGVIRFRYRDNQGKPHINNLSVNQFIKLILQHVLPKGFRRIRDYGFFNGNARTALKHVQWTLQVVVPPKPDRQRPVRHCPLYGGVMHLLLATARKRVDDG